MEFRLLGPLRVEVDGRDLTPARPKQRALLALLLLRADEVVSTDDLIDALWGPAPPQTAQTALQGHVSALRKSLGAGVIETRSPGYRLHVDPNDIDIHRFERLLREARDERDPAKRAAVLRAALGLFRGDPCTEFRYEPFAATEASRLVQLRLAALADRADAELELGQHLELVGELEQFVGVHPHEERLRALLMLALYRAGRQTQALDVYAEGRRLLVDQLGIEPGPALQQLERRILNQDPALAAAATHERRPGGTVTFLFSDIEGSTRLLRELGAKYAQALERHRELLRSAFRAHFGHEIDTQGDSFFVAFDSAKDAVSAAVEGQRALAAYAWPEGQALQVRIGIHTCEAQPTREGYTGIGIHRAARICAAGHGGQTLVSQTTRELLEEEPLDDVDLRDLGAHRLKDLLQPDRIFQVLAPALREDFPPLETLDLRPTNLPTQPTALIGRRRELEELRPRIRRDNARVLTLTGAGGAGKTRLALQAAADVLGHFPDGTFFVPLAAIADPDDVIPAIAQTLNVREIGGRSLQRALDDYLAERTLLLVVDNVEHVVGAAPAIAGLLDAAPGLRLLATSREPLRIAGERVYPVPPLALADSVDLFLERAQEVRPTFELSDANGSAVAEICDRLDNLPLAIELAAARVVLFPPAALLSRLDERLKLLSSGRRDRPERHQTLEAAIDWSHDLLSPARRTLFARLSVFSGGCTLEAAETVCNGDLDVIDGLGSLIDKNLVRLEGTEEEPRFAMLETIRVYARAKLDEIGSRDELRDRHLAWAVAFAERVDPQLRGHDQSVWLERLQAELDNFRSAFAWAIDRGAADLALRLGSSLVEFWIVRADWSEGRSWLERALNLPGEIESAARMKALHAAGQLADALSDYGAATTCFEESLAIARCLDDRRGVAEAQMGLAFEAERVGRFVDMRPLLEDSAAILRELGDEPSLARSLGGLAWLENDFRRARALWSDTLALQRRLANKEIVGWTLIEVGFCAQVLGDYEAARRAYDESLGIARELSYERMTARVLTQLGDVALAEGQVGDARRLFEQSLPTWHDIGHRSGLVDALRGLGDVARVEGDYEAAGALLEESLALALEIGARPRVAMALHSLGVLAGVRGDAIRAESLFEEALDEWREMNDVAGTAETLRRVGELVTTQGRFEHAVRLFGEAAAMRERVGAAIAARDRATYEQALMAARAGLSDSEFETVWADAHDAELFDEAR